MKNILVTGGLGFIGSHTCISLLESGNKIIIIDSNIRFATEIISRLEKIGELKNLNFKKRIFLFEGDIRNKKFLNDVFNNSRKMNMYIDAVIHFAGLKSVRESVKDPFTYWDVNVCGSLNLFEVMNNQKCKTLVFSSSAMVYGTNNKILTEDLDLKPVNPYGFTKAAVENILKNIYESDKTWRIANLRYFNPIGAHSSGLIGENPTQIPENIFPNMCQVGIKKRKKIYVFGNDWPTNDGTCVRDYIHIMDLANAHESALAFLIKNQPQNIVFNIGTGQGTSVLELITSFCNVNNCLLDFELAERRLGDVAKITANTKKVLSTLNWRPEKTLNDMCFDGFMWQKLNPNGYEGKT